MKFNSETGRLAARKQHADGKGYKFTRDDCQRGGRTRWKQMWENEPWMLLYLKQHIQDFYKNKGA